MLRSEIEKKIGAAVSKLIAFGDLPVEATDVPIEVADAKSADHGDFACNFALAASRLAGKNPREIGEALKTALIGDPDLDSIEVAGPGFLNLRLKPAAISRYVCEILALGDKLAGQVAVDPQRINVEFVSVNPNGPITVGSGRGAAFGDTLCRVLEAVGHTINREYYINDGTNSEQMIRFAESVKSRFYERLFPVTTFVGDPQKHKEYVAFVDDFLEWMGRDAGGETAFEFARRYQSFLETKRVDGSRIATERTDVSERADSLAEFGSALKIRHIFSYGSGHFVRVSSEDETSYAGDYVRHVANQMADEMMQELGGSAIQHFGSPREWFQSVSQQKMIESQRADLATFDVRFDTWFSEQSLHDSGEVDRRIEDLLAKGVADEQPHRVKLKLGKGGVLEDVFRESQAEMTATVEDEETEEEEEEEEEEDEEAQGRKSLWLRSTKFGDDMDRVLRRKDGRLTYIASDVAYHKDKFNRPPNADKLITVLGPDHHGYIARLHAVLAALELEIPKSGTPVSGVGISGVLPAYAPLDENEAKIYRSPEERDACRIALEKARKELEVIIFQIVRFVKDGKPAPMRKRDGNIYELRDLIRELGQAQAPDKPQEEQERIGADVARFFYLMRSHDSHMDFDIDLATKQSDENPVFYVQYAHARICSVIAKAQESIPDWKPGSQPTETQLAELTHERELSLIKKILELPEIVARCASDCGVHRLTTYAVELARTYHHFYDACRVIQPDQPDLSCARLALCEAARTGLSTTLDLLGVSAPERMERTIPAA